MYKTKSTIKPTNYINKHTTTFFIWHLSHHFCHCVCVYCDGALFVLYLKKLSIVSKHCVLYYLCTSCVCVYIYECVCMHVWVWWGVCMYVCLVGKGLFCMCLTWLAWLMCVQMPYTTRLMRAIATMARREGKETALNFFDLQNPHDVSGLFCQSFFFISLSVCLSLLVCLSLSVCLSLPLSLCLCLSLLSLSLSVCLSLFS